MAEFQKGSIIVCPDCLMPIYALEQSIGPLDRAGQAARKFRPLTRQDLSTLQANRPDLPAGWQVMVRNWERSGRATQVLSAERPKPGDACICPNCAGPFATFKDREYGTADDRAYELQILDIPPAPTKVHQMAARKKWMSALDDRFEDRSQVVMKDGVPVE